MTVACSKDISFVMADSEWGWNPKRGKSAGLLYEPGNWGDLLKNAWLVRVLEWALKRREGSFSYVDLFAGAPVYHLPPVSARRYHAFSDEALCRYASSFVDNGVWPSAASLAKTVDPNCDVTVCEADPARRQALIDSGQFNVSPTDDGWQALREHGPGGNSFVLVDPYDFLAEWDEQLSAVLECAKSAVTLVYIFNRSGRGQEHLRRYRKFRTALDDVWCEKIKLIGRVPADSFLPRTHHEMLMLAPETIAGDKTYLVLRDSLAGVTRRLHNVITDGAVVEL